MRCPKTVVLGHHHVCYHVAAMNSLIALCWAVVKVDTDQERYRDRQWWTVWLPRCGQCEGAPGPLLARNRCQIIVTIAQQLVATESCWMVKCGVVVVEMMAWRAGRGKAERSHRPTGPCSHPV